MSGIWRPRQGAVMRVTANAGNRRFCAGGVGPNRQVGPVDPPGDAEPELVAPPSISQAIVGSAVSFTPANVIGTPTPTLTTRTWHLEGMEIPGSTPAGYTPIQIDQRGELRIREVWTNPLGSLEVWSLVAIVGQAPVLFAATLDTRVSGNPRVGVPCSVNRAVLHSWPRAALVGYQWHKNGVPISGATGKKYTPVVGDVGATLTCMQTWQNVHGTLPITSQGAVVLSVAAEVWVDPVGGLDTNPGTLAQPWQRVPGQAGANAVSNQTIINVKNGVQNSFGALTVNANNLTYRGYGVAGNVLNLTLPDETDPSVLLTVPVVREPGVHEGMWILNMAGVATRCFDDPNTRFGLVLEDMNIIADPLIAQTTCRMGNQSAVTPTQTGVVMRRCRIYGSGEVGLVLAKKNNTIEECKVQYSVDDCVTLRTNTENNMMNGGLTTFERMEIRSPNKRPDGSTPGALGDCFQNLLSQEDPRNETGLSFWQCYFYKEDGAKQTMVFHDAWAGCAVETFNYDGPNNGRHMNLYTRLRGPLMWRNGWVAAETSELAFARYTVNEQVSIPAAMTATASVTLEDVYCVEQKGGVIDIYDNGFAATFDGHLVVRGCSILGNVSGTQDSDAAYSMDAGAGVLAPTFNFRVLGCLANTGGTRPATAMEAGTANDKRFTYLRNDFNDAAQFKIGTTFYSTVAQFEAAHSGASNNREDV